MTNVTVKGTFVGGGLFEPRKANDLAAEKYSACIVLDKGEEAKVQANIDAAVKEKWAAKKPHGMQEYGSREGDDEEFEASFGKQFINPKSTRPPKTLMRDSSSMMVQVSHEEDIIYPGCKVAVLINAYAYEGNKGKGIKPGVTLNLVAVMFLAHGERIGGTIDVNKEFEGFDSEFDADDFMS